MSPSPRYGRAYLRGPWWAELRQRYADHPEAPHSCAVCGTPRYQLHHRTYERLGAEHVSDLIALCDQHHHSLHRAWNHHHEQQPEDTLAAFTDAWVVIHRRPYSRAHAPLPDLTLMHDLEVLLWLGLLTIAALVALVLALWR